MAAKVIIIKRISKPCSNCNDIKRSEGVK